MKKQEFFAALCLALLLIAAGAIEGAWWILSPICVIAAAVCVVVGGLTEYKG